MSQFKIENQGTNSFLVYSLDVSEEIDQISLGMISNNEVPNMLPISFHQINSERKFRYNISSTISLKRFLEGTITKQRALNLFKSICDAFVTSEEYLLDNGQFVIDPDYIFVEPMTGKAGMVYLAIIGDDMECSVDCVRFFKQLLLMIRSDANDDCNYIASILNYLNTNDNFSLQGFQKLLIQLSGNTVIAPSALSKKHTIKEEKGETERGGSSKQSGRQEEPKKPDIVVPDPNKKKAPDDKDSGFEIPGGGYIKKDEPQREVSDGNGSDNMSVLWLLRNFSGENLKKFNAQKERNNPTKGKKSSKKSGKKPKKNKRLVLVSLNKAYPYTWTVDKERFTIGRRRTNDGSLTEVSNKIGREHCAIEKEKGLYYVVDLNSRNGTIVDGVLYQGDGKKAELHDGSIIELPNIMFRADFQ